MEKLFTDFAGSTAEEWKSRLEKDLKGITFEQLSVVDRNGITIHPFYTTDDTENFAAPVAIRADWTIVSKIQVTDAEIANKKALAALNDGASGLHFVMQNSVDIAVLLQNIALEYIYSHFEINKNTADFSSELSRYLKESGVDTVALDSFISYDFIHKVLTDGSRETEEQKKAFLSLTTNNHKVSINATLFQNAGATAAYELACTLAQVNEYLNIISEGGNINELKNIQIALATDTSFFEQITKLRALRSLLSLVFNQYNIDPKVHLHIETSNTYRSPYDSYSNLLRDSIAGMAAVIGGCDSLYIHPFDEAAKTENAFSERMSRNQQLIFKEESYLNKVADISAGSFYLESLTEQLAAAAWKQFQAIEKDGGLLNANHKGIIKETIDAQAQGLVQEYKEGKRVLIGINKFVNANDEPKPVEHYAGLTHGLKPLKLANDIR